MKDGFVVDGKDSFEGYAKDLLTLAQKELPRESKNFVRREGNKLRKKTLELARQRVQPGKNHKGDGASRYHKNIKAGKVYIYKGNGGTSIRVHSSKAPHAHLIEDGHRLVRGGKEVGFVEGKHVFEDAAKGFEAEFVGDIDDFLDDVFSGVEK